MIRVFIIDDHPMIIAGVKTLLADAPGILLTGCAVDGFSAALLLEQYPADVVLLDINLPDIDGIILCRELKVRFPDLKILGLSTYKERSFITRLLEAGASGYLLKNAPKEEIKEAIETAFRGRIFMGAEVTHILTQTPVAAQAPPTPILTTREKEVLGLIADGYTNHEIASQLFISPLTVDSHRKNLLAKFNVSNTAALIKYAMRCELVG